jgi:sec-independent protein translocase protein TatB
MFDFSFSELMVVMVVALVVLGPERLPKVARTLGHLWGRAQRYVNGVKADIERDMAVEEFRQLQQKVQADANAVGQSVKQIALTADEQVQQINAAVAKLAAEPALPPDPVIPPDAGAQPSSRIPDPAPHTPTPANNSVAALSAHKS